ncbi:MULTISPECIES: acetoacetate--CoA ligase [Halopseudomonas]|jgi:acetoacetyl-CoA synthetase|uniref:acetoacetate--CoA ligase n=1 Tax=Halopseudomonas TaxID=2901189 RepID=UPI000C8E55F3|nr:acetoacetate--CoA ligase [Pseudomonadales bacterium]HBT56900.1 acetoacetate--CoA ligase [Pseudomonas sp.]|tara:strand:+ start:4089 stop:6044 length:1956 start_codon:yes stop_codon:yes gene_type:complete
MSEPLWRPAPERVAASRMDAFRRFINQRHDLALADYAELHQWSVSAVDAFWQAVADFFAVDFSTPPQRVLDNPDAMPGAQWFAGAELNFAAHLLRRRDDHPALVAISEDGQREQLSYAELAARAAGLQQHLLKLGVQPGDRVAALMPNTWQTVVGMLAAASIGAVWSSCSPDFGAQGVVDRFGQIEPRVLIACSGYRYAGKQLDMSSKLAEILPQLGGLQQLIIVPYGGVEPCLAEFASVVSTAHWDDVSQPAGSPAFTALPFAQPLYILYSSGTTGVPKCIVHGAGGTLLQHLKEHGLHTDLGSEDVLFYFTTCGWMMWNWLVSGLALGATLVLYDGSPFEPSAERLIDLVDAENISIFGTSAKYLAALEKAGVEPNRSHQLSRLKAVLSTGSPLAHEGFDYVYRCFKADLCLSSISGGTDIVSCFALGNPTAPVWRGELQCKGLGMAVEVWDDEGQRLAEGKGELVCTRPFPSMPLGFWKDEDGSRFRAAYFERFPGVWAHGDYAEETPHGGLIIHGRSDAVLNPGGVRIGTAEIYRQVEKVEAVLESLAIGQQWQGDVRVVLFVRLREGMELDAALEAEIRQVIRANATPRHVPAKIIAVSDIPRTRSGKIVELAVRNVVHGLPVKNTDALANPEALELFRDLSDLQY